MDATQFVQFLISGLTTGGIYALVAIGFLAIYNITGILNFAQGEFAMIGALTCISLVNVGFPLFSAIPLAIITAALVGFCMERTTISPARNAPFLVLLIITLGVSILLRGVGLIIWGTYPLTLQPFSRNPPISLFGGVIIPQSIWIFATLVLFLLVLYLLFEKTILGTALKACIINRRAAGLMGINIQSMSALAFTMSAAIGATAGIVAAPITSGTYDMGFMLGLKGFVAMVIGGIRSVAGAVLGGFLLGINRGVLGRNDFYHLQRCDQFCRFVAGSVLLAERFAEQSEWKTRVAGR